MYVGISSEVQVYDFYNEKFKHCTHLYPKYVIPLLDTAFKDLIASKLFVDYDACILYRL